MSVSLILPALAAFQKTLAGVAIAFPTSSTEPLPDSLADLPAFVNYEGAASEDLSTLGSNMVRERRRYRMLLYVANYREGIEGEGEVRARPFFTSVPRLFAGLPSLGNIPGVQRIFPAGDSGLITLNYAQQPYWGIEFYLDVEYNWRRVYASGE